MFVPFENLDATSRIWIYQLNRAVTPEEEDRMSESLRAFCNAWSAHGHPLKTSFKVEYRQFLILALDEGFNAASGCSIDDSMQFLKALQTALNVDFFDRSRAAFLVGGHVKFIPLKELKAAFSNGILTAASLSFNTQIPTKGAWENNAIGPAGDTWLARYLPDPAVSR